MPPYGPAWASCYAHAYGMTQARARARLAWRSPHCQAGFLHQIGAAGLAGLEGPARAGLCAGLAGPFEALEGAIPGLGGAFAGAWNAGGAGEGAACLFSLCKRTVLAFYPALTGEQQGHGLRAPIAKA